MKDVTRRDAVKFATALTVGAAGMATAAGQEPKKPAEPRDRMLALAKASPQSFVLDEPVTFRVKTDGRSRELSFTQALDEEQRRIRVSLKSGTMRIFRADAGVDALTEQGGLRWEFFDQKGDIKLKTPGAIVMAVREDDTVRCYTMTLDFRC